MKRTTLYLILALALTSASLALERYKPATGSLIRIEGTSTLHEWSMEGKTINGQLAVSEGWQTAGVNGARVSVVIPVASIKSAHDRMDRLMAEALKAKSNPEIRYEMTGADVQNTDGTNFTLRTNGKLTIAGTTRDVTMEVAGARRSDGHYVLTGQAPIRMTDYGIKPPTAMLNAIKTGNDVKVTFRWVVEATN